VDLPLLLCGPILRRVEPTLVSVRVTLRDLVTVAIRLWEGLVSSGAGNMFISSEPQGTATLRVPCAKSITILWNAGRTRSVHSIDCRSVRANGICIIQQELRQRRQLMNSKVQNLTNRMVSIRANSGETRHLPPLGAVELSDADIAENSKIAKLVANGVVGIENADGGEAAATGEQEQNKNSRRSASRKRGTQWHK
jgi:hypothetical protein